MAKPRHDQQTTSSRTTLAILTAGGVLVAALIVWALTRTVESESTVDTTATTTTPVDPGFFATDTTATLLTTAATPTPPAAHPQGDTSAVTRIAAEDLRAKLNRAEVTVLDVRDAVAYAREHIPGALNVPFATLEGQIDTLPKGKAIVTYCT